jgi:hypothetical protein
MSSTRPDSAAPPDLSQVRTSTLKSSLRRKSTLAPGVVEMTPQMLASVCFDEAVIAAGLTNQGIAADLGVNESIVGRWRNVNAKESPSLLYLSLLGPEFLRLLYRGYSRRCGWGRYALLDLVEALGDVAVNQE